MKRQIAGMLIIATLLSLVGCAKESEETKKKKKKKKATTTTSETEITDPSESTETPSDTSETSDVTAPTDPAPTTLTLTHDLQMLAMQNYPIERAYGEMSSAMGEDFFFRIDEQCDYYMLMTDGYPALGDAVEQIFNEQQRNDDATYEEALRFFPEFLASLTPESQVYIDTYIADSSIVVRADEKVLSFSCYEFQYDFLDNFYTNLKYYTFDSQSGKLLTLSDVVTDKNKLADELENYKLDADDEYNGSLYNDSLDQAIAALHNGKDLPFLVFQNCIEIMLPSSESNYETPYRCILSALECSDFLDMSYFTSTTLNYSLMQDDHGNIVWDFDEDGNIDTLSILNQGIDDNYMLQISLEYNGTPCPEVHQDLYDMQDIDNAVICKTDNGFYLYLGMASEDPVYSMMVFHFENGTFVQVGQTTEFDKYPYNPADCLINTRSELLGTGHKTRRSTLIGGNGMPIPVEDYYAKSGLACTKDDMTLESLGADMNPTGETILIPARTPIRLIGIDAGQQFAIFTTLNQNEEENRLFKMLVYEDEYGDFDVAYDLKGQIDLFDGMLFAD
ncbi:MAG: hypothetical protein KBT07_05035 [Clostridiales bacterium]|nr:hypothetical protein [Candidatus Scatonaster coprocaballi]